MRNLHDIPKEVVPNPERNWGDWLRDNPPIDWGTFTNHVVYTTDHLNTTMNNIRFVTQEFNDTINFRVRHDLIDAIEYTVNFTTNNV